MNTMNGFDTQLLPYSSILIKNVKIPAEFSSKVATQISNEVKKNKIQILESLSFKSPVDINSRYDEIQSFQVMMETFNQLKVRPQLARSQVIVQNYICFVYLKDVLFDVLNKTTNSGSVTKKCTSYITDGEIRSFRNAIAHGNWEYNRNSPAIEYWALRNGKKDEVVPNNIENLIHYSVDNEMLNFWQMLARVVAYTTYITLLEK